MDMLDDPWHEAVMIRRKLAAAGTASPPLRSSMACANSQ